MKQQQDVPKLKHTHNNKRQEREEEQQLEKEPGKQRR